MIAFEHNVATNAALRDAGVEVFTFPGELIAMHPTIGTPVTRDTVIRAPMGSGLRDTGIEPASTVRAESRGPRTPDRCTPRGARYRLPCAAIIGSSRTVMLPSYV